MHLRNILLSFILISTAINGYAQFGPAILADTAATNFSLTAKLLTADIDGDGRQDIVRVTGRNKNTSNAVVYYLNEADGKFSAAHLIAETFDRISDIAINDLNGDGKPDLVVLDRRAMAMYVYTNTGGSFTNRLKITSSKFTTDAATVVLSRDFTGDGHADLMVKDHFDVLLFPGLGNGSFDSAQSLIPPAMQTELYHLVAGEFDGDQFTDFAVSTSGYMTFLNDGAGHFAFKGQTNGTVCFLMAPGDLNGDGIDDMLMKDHKTHILMNDGSGNFTETGLLKPANASYRSFSIADIDGDGDKDVYSVYDQQNRAVWFRNNGSGSLDSEIVFHNEPQGGLYSCALADVNNDGKQDALWANFNGRMGVHLNDVPQPSGIATAHIFKDMQVYPNPAGYEVWVDIAQPAHAFITDAMGRTVSAVTLQAGKQSISLPYPDGIYFMNIQTGDDVQTVRLVKQSGL